MYESKNRCYRWTIIQVNNRVRYFATLETASVEKNILPFTLFVKDESSMNLRIERRQ